MSIESYAGLFAIEHFSKTIDSFSVTDLNPIWELDSYNFGVSKRTALLLTMVGIMIMAGLIDTSEVNAQSCTVSGANVLIRNRPSISANVVGGLSLEGETRPAEGIVESDGRLWVQISEAEYVAASVTTTEACSNLGTSAVSEAPGTAAENVTVEADAACRVEPQGSFVNVRAATTTASNVIGTIVGQVNAEGTRPGEGGTWIDLEGEGYVAGWVAELSGSCPDLGSLSAETTVVSAAAEEGSDALNLSAAVYDVLTLRGDEQVYHGTQQRFGRFSAGNNIFLFAGSLFDGTYAFGNFLKDNLYSGRSVILPDGSCIVLNDWEYTPEPAAENAGARQAQQGYLRTVGAGGNTTVFTSADAGGRNKWNISMDCDY